MGPVSLIWPRTLTTYHGTRTDFVQGEGKNLAALCLHIFLEKSILYSLCFFSPMWTSFQAVTDEKEKRESVCVIPSKIYSSCRAQIRCVLFSFLKLQIIHSVQCILLCTYWSSSGQKPIQKLCMVWPWSPQCPWDRCTSFSLETLVL